MSVTVPSPQSGSHTMKINKALLMRLAPLFSLVLLVLFFSFSSPFFFNTENIMTIALQTAVIGIMAIGVYITYSILDFPDLTVDGSFPLGGLRWASPPDLVCRCRSVFWQACSPAGFAAM